MMEPTLDVMKVLRNLSQDIVFSIVTTIILVQWIKCSHIVLVHFIILNAWCLRLQIFYNTKHYVFKIADILYPQMLSI